MGDRTTDDAAIRSLMELAAQLDSTISELKAARLRADELIEQRASGRTWLEIVSTEEPPLVIERITRALEKLGEVGSRFRREEALALRREQVSITDIGALFRVSRQRVSALVQDRD